MPQLIDYFHNDFKGTSFDLDLTNSLKNTFPSYFIEDEIVKLRIVQGVETPIRIITFYISSIKCTFELILCVLTNLDQLIKDSQGITMRPQHIAEIQLGEFRNEYSFQIYFYTEMDLTEQELKELNAVTKAMGVLLTIRSTSYTKIKNESRKPLAFISHDSNDKELIARPIFHGLQSRLCQVWFDEYSLKIGDSLRDSIEKGIKEAHRCILILTPNFLKNPGWTKKEFDSIYTREIIKNEKVFLPIWYRVDKNDIYEYSPELSLRVANKWPSRQGKSEEEYKMQVEVLISKLHTTLTQPPN